MKDDFNKVQITVSKSPNTEKVSNTSDAPKRNSSDFLKPYRQRKRSSSFTESSSSSYSSRSDSPTSKNGTLKASSQPQYITTASDTYNVQNAFRTTSPYAKTLGQPGNIAKSRSSQELQHTKPATPPRSNFNHHPGHPNHHPSHSNHHPGHAHNRSGSWLYSKQDANVASRTTNAGPPPDHNSSRIDQQPSYNSHTLKNTARTVSSLEASHSPDIFDQPATLVRTNSPQPTNEPATMTSAQRDMLNNEVYQDIGLGLAWVPSLSEYSSRASVCESASIVSRKEV